jgi:hypothetical protein
LNYKEAKIKREESSRVFLQSYADRSVTSSPTTKSSLTISIPKIVILRVRFAIKEKNEETPNKQIVKKWYIYTTCG